MRESSIFLSDFKQLEFEYFDNIAIILYALGHVQIELNYNFSINRSFIFLQNAP